MSLPNNHNQSSSNSNNNNNNFIHNQPSSSLSQDQVQQVQIRAFSGVSPSLNVTNHHQNVISNEQHLQNLHQRLQIHQQKLEQLKQQNQITMQSFPSHTPLLMTHTTNATTTNNNNNSNDQDQNQSITSGPISVVALPQFNPDRCNLNKITAATTSSKSIFGNVNTEAKMFEPQPLTQQEIQQQEERQKNHREAYQEGLKQQQHQQQQQQQQQRSLEHPGKPISKSKLASVPTTQLSSRSIVSLRTFQGLGLKKGNDNNKHSEQGSTHAASRSSSSSSLSSSELEVQHINEKAQEQNQNEKKRPSSISPSSSNKRKSPELSPPEQLQSVSQDISFTSDCTLQSYFEKILASRGYSTTYYCSLNNGYNSKPTPIQIASYGNNVMSAVRRSDKPLLTKLLEAGISANPCNSYGESLIHLLCRRGNIELLKIFSEYGCEVQICDDFGRTPLHDACWTVEPQFDVVRLLLTRDRRLLNIVDCRGSSPLQYVKRDNWPLWVEFLDSVKDVFWPMRDLKLMGEEEPPELVGVSPNTIIVKDPVSCPGIENVTLLAMGEKEPEEFIRERKSDVSDFDGNKSGSSASLLRPQVA